MLSLDPASPLPDPVLIPMGAVMGVFGIQGALRIRSDTDPIGQLAHYQPWWIQQEGQQAPAPVEVLSIKPYRKGLLAYLAGYDSPETARIWVGAQIWVPRTVLPPLPAGQYYWQDLLRMSVWSPPDRSLGHVCQIQYNGAQTVIGVSNAPESHKQSLQTLTWIPFVQEAIVDRVDTAQGQIWLVPGWEF